MTASRVDNSADKHTPCARAAQDAAPVMRAYSVALPINSGGVPMALMAQWEATV